MTVGSPLQLGRKLPIYLRLKSLIRTGTTFLLVVLLALGLRLAGITFDSFWLDEGYQTMVDAIGQPLPDFTQVPDKPYLFKFGEPQPVRQVLEQFRSVDPLCPPLHAVLLNRWMTVFGQSDLAIRSLSVVFSLCALTAIYWFVYGIFGPRVAFFTGLIQALSPFDIFYAQEARMYSLLIFCASMSFGSLLLLAQRCRQRCLQGKSPAPLAPLNLILLFVHALFAWGLINTHYTGLFVFLAEIAFGLWAAFSLSSWRFLFAVGGAWVTVALLWLPWFPLFQQASKLRRATFYVTRENGQWWWPFYAMGRVVINWIIFLAGKKVISWWATPVYVTSAALLFTSVVASLRLRRKMLGPALPLTGVWFWLVIPPLVLLVMDVIESHRVVEIPRYIMATAPAVYVLCGLALAFLSSLSALATAAARWLLVAHCSFSLLSNLSSHILPQREPWRNVAAYLEQTMPAEQPLVLVAQPYDLVCLNRYLTKPIRQVGVSPVLGTQHLSAIVGKCQSFILITAQEGEAITGLVPGDFQQAQKKDFSQGIHVRVYTKSPAPP